MSDRLPEALLSKVSQIIEEKMALYFPENQLKELEQKLKPAALEFGFSDQEPFYQRLICRPLSNAEIKILASYLTIPESYFWREPKVFDALEKVILNELISTGKIGKNHLRIWSVGCASGEEPYSIAIAIKRTIPEIENWKISILGTDFNPKMLRKAETGIYGEWSFRNSPSWLKEKYFHSIENGKFEISAEIRSMVRFAFLNLAEKKFPCPNNDTSAMDIIFCRNVLMYFSSDQAREIGKRFFDSLNHNGWLIVSSSELSQNLFPQFTPVNFPEAIAYRKTPPEKKSVQSSLPAQFLVPPKTFIDKKPVPAHKSPIFTAKREVEPLNPIKDPTAFMMTVRALADSGNLEEALVICEQAISENKLDPQLHLLHGNILQEQNRNREAISAFKRAIYICSDFFMGHFALGNLHLQHGNLQAAKKHFENAISLLSCFQNTDIVKDSEGLTAGRLREIISKAMQTGGIK